MKGDGGANPRELQEFVERLNSLIENAPAQTGPSLSTNESKKLRAILQKATSHLEALLTDLDPVKQPQSVFDPSNPQLVARFVALTLLAQERYKLQRLDKFYGAGVYALYYSGDFPIYAKISGKEHPIYVGKADPADPSAKIPTMQGERLASRLNDHRRNIEKAQNLKIEDFEYRFLVVQSGWQNAAESYLINLYEPIWNTEVGICYGFGKHGDDPETRANLRSPWDTLHPGRDWAHRDKNQKDAKPKESIEAQIKTHFEIKKPLATIEQVFKRLMEEMRQMPKDE